ncbi:MAG: amidophosphoribosyltransferase [Bacteroidota bacterium]
MSDNIKHECGIAMIRLLKPIDYYIQKYGSAFWGLNKLYLLMEKQHNRGQDGAGIACIKFDVPPGTRFINRIRSNSNTPIKDCFDPTFDKVAEVNKNNSSLLLNSDWLKKKIDFVAELYLGHLRYGTFGKNNIDNLHPFVRHNNWQSRNLVVAGNFNMTNVDELFAKLVSIGQHPIETADTITILEKIGSILDDNVEKNYRKLKEIGLDKQQISSEMVNHIDIQSILTDASQNWDGGYVIGGMIGHGDAFVLRDPNGIRPAFWFQNDEVVVVASERPAIQTAFNLTANEVKELEPGHALVIKKNGSISNVQINSRDSIKKCSFERIYFSRGTDQDIYQERKKLGAFLVPSVLKAIDYDIQNTLFSYIPNTAQAAFFGMFDELRNFCNRFKKEELLRHNGNITSELLDKILAFMPRIDMVAVKDAKLRTFITQDSQRDDLVAHVYDVTYGVVKQNTDTLVVLDDSIVRGTTLKQSIIRMLDRLSPKRIIIVSSAPQIRYPDCYGIDMAKLNDFIAFQATIELLKDTKQTQIISEVYQLCNAQQNFPKEEMVNHVRRIYAPFTAEQISAKISTLVTPKGCNADVQVIYNTIEDLHKACPEHLGDWYFTGHYPTPGGIKVLNQAFINYIENRNERAY